MLFFLFFLLFANASTTAEERLWVELDREDRLMPLYLGDFDAKNGPFEKGYLDKLLAVMRFDLHFSGYCEVVAKNPKKEELIQKWIKEDPYADITALNCHFLVQPFFKDKALGVELVSINSGTHKRIEGIVLTGTLANDRRLIHNLSDRIVKEFFAQEGVAATKILFTIKNGNLSSEVFECDYDGGNLRQVSQGGGYIVTPVYVPPKPGSRPGSFFYVSYLNGQPKLFYSPLSTFQPSRFSTLKGNQLMPTLSRERDAVVFITDVTGNPDLFLQPIEPTGKPIGKPSQIFSAFKATQGSPSFSPDGKKIALVSNKDGSARIYIIERPSSGASLKSVVPRLISKSTRENTSPSWSLDGKKIAFSGMSEGTRQIWIYDLERERERQVTFGPGHKENPSFAPDSLHIVFNSAEKNGSELYLINLNQKEAVKITSGPGEKRFPNWEPK